MILFHYMASQFGLFGYRLVTDRLGIKNSVGGAREIIVFNPEMALYKKWRYVKNHIIVGNLLKYVVRA